MTAYDEVPYTGRPYADAHPERLATMATLLGMQPAPVEGCRVLEIACGDGANIVPMAAVLPKSEFVGFDIAGQPVEAGRRFAAEAGLTNVTLTRLDLADFPADAGAFDYILAHGLYSWIPAGPRDQLLALIGRHLAPNGVAFVSYNVYPGCYVRRMVWEMLRFHTEPLKEAAQRIDEAQALARLLAEGHALDDAYSALMKSELERFSSRDASFLFHDDLADVNEPCWFHEFVTHAEKHRLQFLCEAEMVATSYFGIAPAARRVLEQLDPLVREQYLDFAKCRRFRQTLLCREEVAINRAIAPARLGAFRFLSRRRGMAEEKSAAAAPVVGEEGVARAILDALDAAAPNALSVDGLAACIPGLGRAYLEQLCLAAAQSGALQLHLHAPDVAATVRTKPLASASARAQAGHAKAVTNLRHVLVELDDEMVLKLLPLLDGTRDAAALAAALGEPRAAVDARLEHLGKLGLLF
ncbi:MAG TPA: methyltransferase regulatory domain-containing protein [Usitatibacter sp.]|nr:methyltransferase regulatory domain-containing protein [Usitatibacter sp.]